MLQAFDEYLEDAITGQDSSPEQRLQQLADWEKAPCARDSHPREEHLLPLHVVAGAANGTAGRVIFQDVLMGVQISSFQFDS